MAPDSVKPLLLSTLVAGPSARRLAWVMLLVSLAVFLAAAPYAKLPLPRVDAFLPIYQSSLVICELMTATLLFGQFMILRSRALLFLASAYLFSALMAAAHALSFPGLFAPTGLLGGGPQTTAWLYFLWHAGFPLLIGAYVYYGDPMRLPVKARGNIAVWATLGLVLALVGALVLLTTQGHDLLPVIMRGNQDDTAKTIVATVTWMLSLVALIWVWYRRRPLSVLDLWLVVVLFVWIFDSALAAVLNGARFDLGWYAGRVYGLLAGTFVLMVLLLENSKLYAKLAAAHNELERLVVADPLTGITNRRGFETTLKRECRRAARGGLPLSLLMIDVDYFKRYNDNLGHAAGDDCLRRVAGLLADAVKREGELAARYGGEEFSVVLPNVALAEAHDYANRLVAAIAAQQIPHPQSDVAPHVTVSIGVAELPCATSPNQAETAPAQLVNNADQALYAAKAQGRHRALCYMGTA